MAATQKATTSVSGHERKKRKHEEDENDSGNVADNLRDLKLDMDSEDEAGDSGGTDDDDGEHHQFPELDVGSDSESDDDDYSDAEEEEEEDEEEEEEESNTSQDDLEDDTKLPGLPPQGKMIRSEITGHPKRVYPEIEPEYDSDSSTENVSAPPLPS
jgi:ribosome biogenesis protein ERB1